jgi:hypothetical protein
MKLSKSQIKSEYLSLILLLVLFVFSGLTAGKLVGYAMNNSSSRSAIEANSSTKESTEENLKKYREQNKEVADGLKKQNLFYAPPPKPEPPKSCQAIFGDEAYIDGKWVKVGATLSAGAKLIAIEATYVVIEHEGKESKLAPIAVAESSRPGPNDAKPSASKGPKEPGTGMKPVDKKGKGTTAKTTSGGEDEFAWLGVELSPELRSKLARLWAIFPDEMKEKAKQDWMKMTDEQKQEALKEFENIDIDMMEEQMQRMQR